MSVPIQTAAERLLDARFGHHLVAPLSETHGDLSLSDAYAIQDALGAELARRGGRPIGWKLAATSPTGQAVMGMKEPAYGFLPSHQYASGAELSAGGFVDLRIEAEVAFKMGSELGGPDVTATSALSAVESALPAFELLDFIYSGTPRAADYVANSIHGQAVVLGNPLMSLQGLDLASEEVLVENNSEFVGTYTAADVMGNPLNALAWLANQLASRGRTLKRGDIVISGGISKLLRPKAGDFINATFTHLGSVAIKVVS
jgi:2-keto-4-pentenoate hydratase